MSKQSDAVKNWRQKTKELIVVSMGGKCVLCGYNKCFSALELHHLNRSEKLFSFSGIRARPREWNIIEQELKKCILVCSNCHKEIEANVVDVTNYKTTYDTANIILVNNTRNRMVGLKKCKHCGVTFRAYNKNQLACSLLCRQSIKQVMDGISPKHPTKKTKICWPSITKLTSMVHQFGYKGTGKKLGVSDNAVRKRLKKHSRVAQ